MSQPKTQNVYIIDPIWMPIYTIFCIVGSFPPLLFTALIFHVSVASDIVFGSLVIIGGPLGDLIFCRVFKKTMFLLPNISIRLIYAWPFIGLLVIIFKPFE